MVELEELSFPDGDGEAARGLVASPAGERREPGTAVVLVPDARGPDAPARAAAERLAEAGHLTLLVDPRGPEGAPLPDRRALARLDAAAEALAARGDVDRRSIAILGIGAGGTLAFQAGCTSTRFACVVDVGGGPLHGELSAERPIQPIELLLNLDRPLLCCFGEEDPRVPCEHVELLRERLEMAAKDFALATWPGSGAQLLDERLPGSHAGAAAQAWAMTLAFLAEKL